MQQEENTSVQSDLSTFVYDESEPLVVQETKKVCKYVEEFFGLWINVCTAHLSWIMASGLIINAAMGVRER